MKANEIKRTIIDVEGSDESFKKCEAALISNINNLLNIGEHETEYTTRDPFDPSHSKAALFCLEAIPIIAKDLPEEMPWSFDSQSLKKFNQELRELILGDQELKSSNLSRFIPDGILAIRSSEKEEWIQELPRFFQKTV